MPITIYLVRHAQGFHNLPREPGGPDPLMLRDPGLTEVGKEQCAELCASFPYHDKVTHLVASPFRRTLQTALLSFRPAVEAGKRVVAQPLVQEISTLKCDLGSPPEVLAREFDGREVDLGLATKGWNDKSPDTPWAPKIPKLEARARAARKWLRDLAAQDGGDAHIVVVSHGGFLHFLNEDWEGMSKEAGTGWANTEWRSYEFADESGKDEDAWLVETSESRRRRRGTVQPLTETERMELRELHTTGMQAELDRVEAAKQIHEAEAKAMAADGSAMNGEAAHPVHTNAY